MTAYQSLINKTREHTRRMQVKTQRMFASKTPKRMFLPKPSEQDALRDRRRVFLIRSVKDDDSITRKMRP